MRRQDKWRTIRQPHGITCPWGPVQHVEAANHPEPFAGSLFVVDTPGHGGALLQGWAARRLAAQFPKFRPYAHEGRTVAELSRAGRWIYLEEDLDMALLPLAFPDLYDRDSWRLCIDALVQDCNPRTWRYRGRAYFAGAELFLSSLSPDDLAEACTFAGEYWARREAEDAAEAARARG